MDNKEDGFQAMARDESQGQRRLQPFQTNIKWINVFYMALFHLGALYSLFLLPRVSLWTVLWTAFLYQVGALGVTAGAHRLWSHRSYKATLPLRVILMMFNCVSGQNSIFDWARKHRVHHKYSETDADPHNSKRGFFFAHVGWLLLRSHPDVINKGKLLDTSDLLADPVVRFQKRYFKVLMVLTNIVFPTVIPLMWGEDAGNAFFLSFVLRYVLVLNATWCVNSVAHIWGNRPYDQFIRPAENIWVSISAFGEGFHNYHHSFPFDYKTSEFGWKINITSLFIDFFAKIGWAYDLKTASKEVIWKRRIRTGGLRMSRAD